MLKTDIRGQPVTTGHHQPGISALGVERISDNAGERLREEFLVFLERYREDIGFGSQGRGGPLSSQTIPADDSVISNSGLEFQSIYVQQLHEMKNQGMCTLYVDYNHLFRFNDILANAITAHFYRFEPFLRAAVSLFVAKHIPAYAKVSNSSQPREFWVSIYGVGVVHRLRELTSQKIGQLMSISGTVTRTSEVRPELYMGVFRCGICNTIVRNVEQQFRYTEPSICPNHLCQNRKSWVLIPEHSLFVNWQRVRIQENANEIPAGSMPRTLDVILRNEMVERAKAGDKCTFTGSLIVIPDVSQLGLPSSKMESQYEGRSRMGANEGITGLKALGVRELSYKLAFLSSMVLPSHIQQGSINIRNSEEEDSMNDEAAALHSFTAAELEEIHQMRNTPNLYAKLVSSIAPSIYGHSEIKTGILLMLFGGVHKVTPEGINLRGDINICIVGDPGTAKSQFLRYVVGFLPRSVYTSGKASSAAGLTASVLKDDETGDFTIEAGALMLADNGICAIDEFDKMDLKDQVAIHEAMEQQTISIAKAGIQATLNARTSILAAANPIGGRYDRRRTLRQNISMTAPIMSRFDLFFVILDECDEQADYNMARHILNTHRLRDEAFSPDFTPAQIQRYIKYSRSIKPKLTGEAASMLVERYRQLRQSDVSGSGSSYRMTVRQLESMIRLSEALARLHGDPEIKPAYVREAGRLLKSSIIRVENDNIDLDAAEKDWQAAAQAIGEETAGLHADAPESAKISLRYEDYIRVSNMLIYQLRRLESLAENNQMNDDNEDEEANDAENTAMPTGMSKSALIEWYLEEIEGEMQTEEDFHHQRRQISAIIERLIHRDGVLLELGTRPMVTDDSTPTEYDPIIVVHPNYVSA